MPTYRGKGGIWKEYDCDNCACQRAFDRDPEYPAADMPLVVKQAGATLVRELTR